MADSDGFISAWATAFGRDRHQYRSFIENMLEGFAYQKITFDAEGQPADYIFLDVNGAFARLIGLRKEEIVGKKATKILSGIKEDPAGWVCIFGKVAITGEPVKFESYLKHLDRWLLISAYSPEKGYFICTFVDITERKKAEEEIARLASFPELSPNPTVELDFDGNIDYVNPAAQSAFPDLKRLGLAHPFLSDWEYLGRVIRNERSTERDIKIDGAWYNQQFYLMPNTQRVRIYVRNITERMKMEDELRKSRDELEDRVQKRTEELSEANKKLLMQTELMDKACEAITVRDLEGRIIYWNRGAEKMYGYAPQEVIGRKFDELLFKDRTQYQSAFEEVAAKGEWSGELKLVAKDGRDLTVDTHWSLVFDETMKPVSVMAISTDITERKSLEAQYFRAQRLESLGTLAGGVAHDFRNILTPVMITLDLLDQHLTEKEDHELIERLQKNLQRGGDLSRKLLTFAKGVGGERVPILMPAFIQEVEKTIKETFPRSIAIEAKIEPDVQTVMGDSTLLHQVLINLCINARDAMPFGGTLAINAGNAFIDEGSAKGNVEAKVGTYVVIAVTDSGVGMPPEVLEKLFEPFFTTKKPGEGTGLGLSTARSIVKSHGGFMSVCSEVGRGSTFKVYLPIADSEGKKPNLRGANSLQGVGQTVLVVDDEELIRMTATAALENNGYKALSAADGAEALGAYTQHRKDIKVVLLDMAMPIMDGEATIRALKRINPEVKIIGMSGLAESDRYRAMYVVTNAFITKPFTTEKLLDVLARVLPFQIRA